MTEERFVDPNSGAAPQPGSYAGPEAAEKGFGPPPVDTATGEGALEEEVVPSAYEFVPPEPQEFPDLKSDDDAEEDEDADVEPNPDAGEEATAVEHAEIEHSATSAGLSPGVEPTDPDGTHPSVLPLEDGVGPAPEPADGDGNPVDPEEGDESDYAELLGKTVPEIVEYMEAHPDEKEAVQAAEAAGEGRKGVANA